MLGSLTSLRAGGASGSCDLGDRCRGLKSQLPRLDEPNENEQALFLPRDAEATRAFRFAHERFPAAGTPVLVVFSEPGDLGAS